MRVKLQTKRGVLEMGRLNGVVGVIPNGTQLTDGNSVYQGMQ